MLVACHDCGLVQRQDPLPAGSATVRCARCRARLARSVPGGLDRALACALAAAVVFALANAFPIMSLEAQGARTSTTLLGTVRTLHDQEMNGIAALVLATGLVLPACQIAAMLAMLLGRGRDRLRAALAFRVWVVVRPWAMVDVLVLAILVAVGKLAPLAHLQPDVALWAFAALMLLLAMMDAAFDPGAFWAAVAPVQPPADPSPGTWLVACESCGLLAMREGPGPVHGRCLRCHAALHARKPASLSRTLALLLAAAILYLPANLLPILETGSLFGPQSDTIISGVAYLWTTGDLPLAVIIFVASVFVPLAKLLGLSLLLISVRWHWAWAPLQRGRLHRVVERIGRWSMLDIFAAALLAALMQFRTIATIHVGPGALAFGAVVVLTMSASRSFDPRLIWDALPERRP